MRSRAAATILLAVEAVVVGKKGGKKKKKEEKVGKGGGGGKGKGKRVSITVQNGHQRSGVKRGRKGPAKEGGMVHQSGTFPLLRRRRGGRKEGRGKGSAPKGKRREGRPDSPFSARRRGKRREEGRICGGEERMVHLPFLHSQVGRVGKKEGERRGKGLRGREKKRGDAPCPIYLSFLLCARRPGRQKKKRKGKEKGKGKEN